MDDNNIEFDTDRQNMGGGTDYTSRSVFGQQTVPGMASWLMKKGIIKNEAQAKNILVAIVIADFAIAIAVIYFFILR